MIYGYIRVSTVKQASEGNSLEGQKKLLLENGVKEENIYKDIYTGTKSDRPSFNELINKLEQGDTLVVTKLDRFARSMIEGSKIVNELIDKGIRVNVLNIGVMDDTPSSALTTLLKVQDHLKLAYEYREAVHPGAAAVFFRVHPAHFSLSDKHENHTFQN